MCRLLAALSPGIPNTNTVTIDSIMRNRAGVVVRSAESTVRILDNIQNTMATRASPIRKRHRPLRRVLRVVANRQRARVSLVQIEVVSVDLPVRVTGLVGNKAEEVSSAIPATQRGKTPVGGHGGDDGVVGVKGVVFSAAQVLGDGTAEQEGEDLVSDLVGIRFVEREHDQRVLGEVFVLQQVMEEAVGPATGESDVGVVGIVGHVRRDEHVLGEFLVVQVVIEGRKVLDLAEASVILGDGVKEDQWVVLADVVARLCFRELEALVAGVGQVFLVLSPCDILGIEQVRDGRDIGRNFDKVIMVHSKCVTTGRGAVVRLRRVRESPEVAQGETLFGQLGEMGVICGVFVVLTAAPY